MRKSIFEMIKDTQFFTKKKKLDRVKKKHNPTGSEAETGVENFLKQLDIRQHQLLAAHQDAQLRT